MSRYKSDMVWNYRIGTKVFSYKKEFEGKEGKEKLAAIPDERVFSVIEVYYKSRKNAEKNRPDSYIDDSKNLLNSLSSKKDIKKTLKMMKKALKKPILDLDHWPKKYIPGSDMQVTNDLYS